MKAIILAAGKGKRFGEKTKNLPKPLLKLGKFTLIEHNIFLLKKYGFNDIVINVSGPLNVETMKNEIPLVKSLKHLSAKTRSGGFVVDNDFKISGLNNIYIPGVLARGFNPERKTIIKAILKNSNKVGQSVAKTLI